METHDFFLYLLIILLTARVFAELATRLQAPSVIGELFAGVALGPSLLGWIEPLETIKLRAEIGIILLLFEVGLETDVKRLVPAGTRLLQPTTRQSAPYPVLRRVSPRRRRRRGPGGRRPFRRTG